MDYPIRLKKISIKNFRKFETLLVEFDGKQYISLAGRNGSGKTSVLEAVHIALAERSSKFTDIKESDFCNENDIEFEVEFDKPFFFKFFDSDNNYSGLIPCTKFKKIIKRRSAKEANQLFSTEYHVMVRYTIDDFMPTPTEFSTIKSEIASSKQANEHLVKGFWKDEHGSYKYKIQSSEEPRECPVNEAFFNYESDKLLFPKSFYFDSKRDRELLPQYNTAFSDIVKESNWRFKKELMKGANHSKKEALFTSFEKMHADIKVLDSYKDTLLSPALSMLTNKLCVELDGEMDFYSLNPYQPYNDSIFGIVTKDNQFVSATQFGSGVSILMALCISISFSEESKIPFIILIDEPELHLHSDLQKNLRNFLQSSEFQVLVSTHSHLFIDIPTPANNLIFEKELIDDKPEIGTPLDISNLIFKLLGNSLKDLYIPEKVLIVEGKHDKNILIKCLDLLGHSNLDLQIIAAGGKTNIPDKSEQYQEVINEMIDTSNWYSTHIVQNLKIIVDGDVTTGKVNGWVTTYRLNEASQIHHIDPTNKLDMENYFPESLVKELVATTTLNDGSSLASKTLEEIIDIVLKDDKITDKNTCTQTTNRISKSRLNTFVQEKITIDILNSPEGSNLKNLAEWVIL